MKRYVDIDELIKIARKNKAIGQALCDIFDFIQIVDDTPTADVREVKHGEWVSCRFNEEKNGAYEEQCSNCLEWSSEYDSNFCPNCGAIMDGGNSDKK